MAEWVVGAGLPNLANTSESSWHEDRSGGKSGCVAGVDTVRVLRLSDALVEVALADARHPQRRLEQHIVMTSSVRGVYTYTAMTIVADGEALNEIRHNIRLDRCVLNHALNHERPPGEQPTYPPRSSQRLLSVVRVAELALLVRHNLYLAPLGRRSSRSSPRLADRARPRDEIRRRGPSL